MINIHALLFYEEYKAKEIGSEIYDKLTHFIESPIGETKGKKSVNLRQ